MQQKFSSPLPSGRGCEVLLALWPQHERVSRFVNQLLDDCHGRSSCQVNSNRRILWQIATTRGAPALDTQTEILEPRPYYTEGAARDSAPEILKPSPCAAASGNESSRIFTVRTPASRVFVLAQFPSFASAAEPPSFPRSLVRREQPQVDFNGHPPRSKSARSDSSRVGEQGTHLLLLEDRLPTRSGGESLTEFLESP